MPIPERELRGALEAILFVAGEPITLDAFVDALPDAGREAIAEQLEAIEKALAANVVGFHLEQAAGGYRLASRPENDPYLRKFFSKQHESRLSLAALETLAIIAYRQPITSPEISDIRGVNSAGVLRTLLERKMIRIAGRKNVVGSPFLYRTTREFLVHFGLNDIRDLPRLEEFAEVLGENMLEELAGLESAGGQGEPEAGAVAAGESESTSASPEASDAAASAAAEPYGGNGEPPEGDVSEDADSAATLHDHSTGEVESAVVNGDD